MTFTVMEVFQEHFQGSSVSCQTRSQTLHTVLFKGDRSCNGEGCRGCLEGRGKLGLLPTFVRPSLHAMYSHQIILRSDWERSIMYKLSIFRAFQDVTRRCSSCCP